MNTCGQGRDDLEVVRSSLVDGVFGEVSCGSGRSTMMSAGPFGFPRQIEFDRNVLAQTLNLQNANDFGEPKFRELEPAGRLASPNRSPPVRGIVRIPGSQPHKSVFRINRF
jgi:hypothetical protein